MYDAKRHMNYYSLKGTSDMEKPYDMLQELKTRMLTGPLDISLILEYHKKSEQMIYDHLTKSSLHDDLSSLWDNELSIRDIPCSKKDASKAEQASKSIGYKNDPSCPNCALVRRIKAGEGKTNTPTVNDKSDKKLLVSGKGENALSTQEGKGFYFLSKENKGYYLCVDMIYSGSIRVQLVQTEVINLRCLPVSTLVSSVYPHIYLCSIVLNRSPASQFFRTLYFGYSCGHNNYHIQDCDVRPYEDVVSLGVAVRVETPFASAHVSPMMMRTSVFIGLVKQVYLICQSLRSNRVILDPQTKLYLKERQYKVSSPISVDCCLSLLLGYSHEMKLILDTDSTDKSIYLACEDSHNLSVNEVDNDLYTVKRSFIPLNGYNPYNDLCRYGLVPSSYNFYVLIIRLAQIDVFRTTLQSTSIGHSLMRLMFPSWSRQIGGEDVPTDKELERVDVRLLSVDKLIMSRDVLTRFTQIPELL